MVFSPLDQFNLTTFYFLSYSGISLAFTSLIITTFFATSFILVIFFSFTTIDKVFRVTPIENLLKFIYRFILNLLIESLGLKGQRFFPFFFTFFTFMLILNLSGLIPYHHTVSSHFVNAISFSVGLFLGLWLISFYTHKLRFFSLFFPKGSPIILAPLIIIIEFVSFLSRPVSLAVRLCANMISGHVLIKILCSFGWVLITQGLFFMLIPMIIVSVLAALEFGIGLLQSYVFTVLLTIYLKEAMYLH